MQPLKDLQKDAPAMYHRRGDQIKYLRTVSPLLGVVGGNKNHDTFTARMGDCVEFLKGLQTKTERRKYIRLQNIRQKICDLVLHKVHGSHVVDNAYFGLNFGTNFN